MSASKVSVQGQTAMKEKLPYIALRDAVFTHPTMAEGLGRLFGAVPSCAQARERRSDA